MDDLFRRAGFAVAERLEADGVVAEISPEVAVAALDYIYRSVIPAFADTSYYALRSEAMRSIEEVPVWERVVRRFLSTEAAEMVVSITDTLRDEIRRVLTETTEAGLGVRAAARRLRDVWPEVSRRRAEVVVRTEVISAANLGSLEGAKASAEAFGLTLEKVFLATSDGRTRDSHSAADGQRRGLDEAFDVGGYPAQYPGDPALPANQRIQCRCTQIYEPAATKARRSFTTGRNERMRAAYAARKGGYDFWSDLVQDLADEHGLAFDTVRGIVHSRGLSSRSHPVERALGWG